METAREQLRYYERVTELTVQVRNIMLLLKPQYKGCFGIVILVVECPILP